jgi:Ca2+-binding EF-hand superfamily protein
MKKQFVKAGILTGIMSLIFSLNVTAQSSERSQRRKEDGKLSEKEAKGPLKRDFDKIDSNEDGFISKEELEKAPKPKSKNKSKRNN